MKSTQSASLPASLTVLGLLLGCLLAAFAAPALAYPIQFKNPRELADVISQGSTDTPKLLLRNITEWVALYI
ncbi:hypothetical protein BGX38DRAFT_1219487 [Terfezia claveryi]|nr:hypothetical protein BGX38DRAFT_1219487 [Terfezia claveryi]